MGVSVCTRTKVSFGESSEAYDCTTCELSNTSNSSVRDVSLSSGFLEENTLSFPGVYSKATSSKFEIKKAIPHFYLSTLG